jgi:hypothetical protein
MVFGLSLSTDTVRSCEFCASQHSDVFTFLFYPVLHGRMAQTDCQYTVPKTLFLH